MQNYAKTIEPKLDEFIAKRNSNTNNEINTSNNKNGKRKTDLSFEIKKNDRRKNKNLSKRSRKKYFKKIKKLNNSFLKFLKNCYFLLTNCTKCDKIY